jgi:hypothetical protein
VVLRDWQKTMILKITTIRPGRGERSSFGGEWRLAIVALSCCFISAREAILIPHL